ncbi:oncostatin-M-specific receptor subunit beta-like isoform 1-T2 [Anomaloglossus baeobatrachus]|uniref:oncostatin-M-specific receptor subunit beta-like n=1 Tax=Anomaloglossus baeobatrachus TaxID=238106 RepID=UPI003F5090F7
MDHCARRHGVIAALFLTLKFGLWHCQETVVSFPPINLEIYNDSLHQRLYVEWNVTRTTYETSDIMFHIQVARSENMNIIENKYFKPDLSISRTSFNWTWDSQLPLECDSHSVRIRGTHVGNVPTAEIKWSRWSSWKTHYGDHSERASTVIYPHERVVLEGSEVTFCCLPGRDQTIQEMMYRTEKIQRSRDMGTDSYVITVKNVTMTRSDGGTVLCVVDNIGDDITPGNVLIVSRPPDQPKNFSCVTEDLQSLICSWIPGPIYNFFRILKVDYDLHEWSSMKSHPCERDHCILQIQQQVYNFTLTAKNLLGERSVNAIVHLNQRVLLPAPSRLVVTHESSSRVSLSWSLAADYTSLQIRCQVKDLVDVMSRGKGPKEIYKVSLEGLQPDTQYDLAVRCMAESSLAGWSKWTHLVVKTKEDAPTGALDVWRCVKDDEDDDKRIVILYWKPSPIFKANGNITHYNIKVQPLEGAPTGGEIRVSHVNSTRISIGRQACAISVTAHNNAGGSTPAELRIPAHTAKDTNSLIAERTYGRDGGVNVTWRKTPSAHGYVVEWCAAPRSAQCDLQWKKYSATIHSDLITSRDFRRGVRYEFRIYRSMDDGEHLLEKKEGYTEELASSVKPNLRISNITPRSFLLDWSPYPLDRSQEGFVTGYNVYVNDREKGCNLDKSDGQVQPGDVCRFYIDDPNKMKVSINHLTPNGKYEVAVVAITGGGETPRQYSEAYTPADTVAALHSIIVPIITVSVMALLLLFIGCWKRAWLKRICLPDIPDPNNSKILSFNGTKGAFSRNILLTPNHEPQIVDIVRIQESRHHKSYDELTESPDHQLQEMDTKIQTREGSKSDEDGGENYLPCGREKSSYSLMNDPSCKSPPFPYLQFCNRTYIGTLDELCDSVHGYRPQTNTEQVDSPPYSTQSADSGLGLHEDSDVCFHSPVYATSPTSVGSATFILVE